MVQPLRAEIDRFDLSHLIDIFEKIEKIEMSTRNSDNSDCDSGSDVDTDDEKETVPAKPKPLAKAPIKMGYKPRAELSKLAYTMHGFFTASYSSSTGDRTSASDNHLVQETLLKVLELGTIIEFERVYDYHFEKYSFLRHILELGDLNVARLVLARNKLLVSIKKMIRKHANGKVFKLASVKVSLLMLMVNHCKGIASRREFYRLCWTSYYTSNLADADDLNELLDAGKTAGFHIYWADFAHFIFKNLCDDSEDYLPIRFRKPRPDKVGQAQKAKKAGLHYVDETNYSEPDDNESDCDNDFTSLSRFTSSSKFNVCVNHIGDLGSSKTDETDEDKTDETDKTTEVVSTLFPPSSTKYVKDWFLARAEELKEMEQMSFCDAWEFQSSTKTYLTAAANTSGITSLPSSPLSLTSDQPSYPVGFSLGPEASTQLKQMSIPEKIDQVIVEFTRKVPAINSMLSKSYSSLWTKTQIRENVIRYEELKGDLSNTSPFAIRHYVRAALLSNFVFDLPASTKKKKTPTSGANVLFDNHTVRFANACNDSESQQSQSSSKFLKANPRSCPQMLLAMNNDAIHYYSRAKQIGSSAAAVRGLLIYEIEKYPGIPIAILSSLAVQKDQRNGGLGKLLMTMFLLILKNLGVKWCLIEAVYAAQNFYQRFGFQDFRCYSPLRKLIDEKNATAKKIEQICRNDDHNFIVNLDELEENDLLLHLTQDDLPVSYSLQSKKRKYFSETPDGKWFLNYQGRPNAFSHPAPKNCATYAIVVSTTCVARGAFDGVQV